MDNNSDLTLMLLEATFDYTKLCKNPEKLLKTLHMVTYLIVLGESFQMNTNMTGFSFFKNLCVMVLWTKVAPALEGLSPLTF